MPDSNHEPTNDEFTEAMIKAAAKILMNQLDAGPYTARSVAKQLYQIMRELSGPQSSH